MRFRKLMTTAINKYKSPHTMFLKFIFSYIFILIIAVLIGMIFFYKIEKIMIKNSNRSNTAMLEQVRQVIDNRFEEVEDFSMQIALDPKLQKLVNNPQSRNYEYIEYKRQILRYRLPSSLINDYYIYFSEPGIVLTPALKADSNLFFNDIQQYEKTTERELFDHRLSTYHVNEYFPAENILTDSKKRSVISFMQSLPFGEKDQVKGALVIHIDERQIRGMLDQIEGLNKGSFLILNEKKEVILSNNELAEGAFQKTQYAENHNDMVVSQATSLENNWSYVSIVPKSVVLSQVQGVKVWSIKILITFIFIGLCASYVLAYRHYRPIKEVVREILKDKGESRPSKANELDFIKETLIRQIEKQSQLNQIAAQQLPVIRADFLARLIKGHIEMNDVTEEDLAFMGIQLKENYFRVMVVHLEEKPGTTSQGTEKEWALRRFIAENVCEELLGKHYYAVEIERDQLAILNNVAANETDSLYVIRQVNTIKNLICEKFDFNITVAISAVHRDFESIETCYTEAKKAFEYRTVKGPNCIIHFDEIKDVSGFNYHYPIEKEVQLFNFSKIGDREGVEKMLTEIFHSHDPAKMTPEILRCLAYDLLGTWFKLVGSLPNEKKQRFLDGESPYTIITNSYSVNDLKNNISDLYKQYCQYVEESQVDNSDQLYMRMVRFMEEHFQDNRFSLNFMAEHFGMNPSYLSTFFKKHGNQNISDFVTQLRIKEAKKMLAHSTETIAEIAKKMGYANSAGLIRVFKKAEGISPGQYREHL